MDTQTAAGPAASKMTSEQKNASRWHVEVYIKALKGVTTTGTMLACYVEEKGMDILSTEIRWKAFFKDTYPELYTKYAMALERITDLWGDKNPAVMEVFKKAVKIETDGTRWAIEKFLEALKRGEAGEYLVDLRPAAPAHRKENEGEAAL